MQMRQLRYSRKRCRPRGPDSTSREPFPPHQAGLPNCHCWATGKLASLTSLLEHNVFLGVPRWLVPRIATCLDPANLAVGPMGLVLGCPQFVAKPWSFHSTGPVCPCPCSYVPSRVLASRQYRTWPWTLNGHLGLVTVTCALSLEGHLCYILGFGLLALLALENCLWISHLSLSWGSNCEY